MTKDKKKVGIVADNYKIDKFKQELTAKGFTDFDVSTYSPISQLIRVNVASTDVIEVKRICERVELHFKRSN